MRTRRGICYLFREQKRVKRRRDVSGGKMSRRKRRKSAANSFSPKFDLLDALPDDLVVSVLAKLCSIASCPAEFISVLLTCKRLNGLGLHSHVLSKAPPSVFAVTAKGWSESAHRFLKQCADAGNVEACYTLGMIRFYCLESRGSGASLMAKAAIALHAQALYSLAVIQFNGSGGTKDHKDLRAGVALCARAAFLGHIDALRELGHCLQDGYGIRQNIGEGRRFLVQANARELAAVLSSAPEKPPAIFPGPWLTWNMPRHAHVAGPGCPLLSDFGCSVPAPEPHLANRFLTEWFSDAAWVLESGLRLCSQSACGRPETRRHEFRRCSVCGVVNYCLRACQALDWKMRHKVECAPAQRWIPGDGGVIDNADGNGHDGEGGEDVMAEES